MKQRRFALSCGLKLAAALIFTLACTDDALAGPDACTLDNPVAICQGNQSNGIASGADFPSAYTILLINNLTADIAPASGTNGVEFISTTPITLSINGGSHSIVTTGGGLGILASSNGNVVLSSIANISTSGDNGDGIRAGSNDTLMLSSIGNITTTGNGARGIAASTTPNGALTLSSIGNISTSGSGSHGIFAGNDIGKVTVLSVGNITTSGNGSNGIQARSTNSDVSVVTSGDIAASGNGSIGVSLSSGSGDLSATVASGSVTGGSGAGVGVKFTGGGTNMLRNFGTVSALSGLAISGDVGDETVNNHGTVIGNVDLGAGSNAFNNFPGASFQSGATANVSAFTNAGTLSPGGAGTLQTTLFDDTLVQTSTGILAIDINAAAGTSDQVIVSNTAALAGNVAVHVTSLPPAGPQQFTILQALGGLTNQGLGLLASPALNAALSFTATDVVLSTSVDFSSVSGLNGNQQAISNSLRQAFAAGGGGLTPVLLGLLNTDGLDAYKAALNELIPEAYSDAQIAALYSSLGFANSLLSCRVNGTATASIIHEGQCLWAGASAAFLDQGTTFNQIGFDQTTGLFAAGAQVALNNLWRLGVGAGYQSSSLETSSGATSDGEQAQAGAALKYNPGPLLLAGVLSGGRGWYDTTRPMAFGGFTATAQSDSTIDVLNGGVRAAYVLGSPELYAKPMLDAAATHLDLNGFSETGGGAANLSVRGSNQTVYTIAPSLEIGTEWWMANGTLVRPFMRGGATWYENGDLALSAAFLSAPAGVSPFTITTGMDDVMGTVGAGLDLITSKDTALHVTYDGQFGATTQISAIALKGSARF